MAKISKSNKKQKKYHPEQKIVNLFRMKKQYKNDKK